jgi:hypothetical protein
MRTEPGWWRRLSRRSAPCARNSRSGAEVLEIYVHTDERRGREKFFSDIYEPPLENFLDIDTTNVGVEECVQRILNAKTAGFS